MNTVIIVEVAILLILGSAGTIRWSRRSRAASGDLEQRQARERAKYNVVIAFSALGIFVTMILGRVL